MTLQETLGTLESLGTAQNRKVYARHGAGENTYGVSFADLGKLAKRIKTDQTLAEGLWDSGNSDARSLALQVADYPAMPARKLEAWAKSITYYCHSEVLARQLSSRGVDLLDKAQRWIESKAEYVAATGWYLISILASTGAELPAGYCEALLERIEREIHGAQNRVRHAMNSAVIGIGIRDERLRKLAIAASGRIGKVHVDHGETGCKTPDAAAYIKKAADFRGKKKRAG
jgi:3-methyladenine DNA glycosylase AlkD